MLLMKNFAVLLISSVFLMLEISEQEMISDDAEISSMKCSTRSRSKIIPSHIPVTSDMGEEFVSCAVPVVANGKVQLVDSELSITADIVRPDTSIAIFCDKGFTLTGGATETLCLESGYWADPIPLCVPDSRYPATHCIAPNVHNGELVNEATGDKVAQSSAVSIGMEVTVNCIENNYEYTSPIVSSLCREGGVWSAALGNCTLVVTDCVGDPKVDNGLVDSGGNTIGTDRAIVCRSGYILSGVATVKCERSGDSALWHSYGTCDKECDPLPIIANGGTVVRGVNYLGVVRRITCKGGFKLLPPTEIRCQTNGSWTTHGRCVHSF